MTIFMPDVFQLQEDQLNCTQNNANVRPRKGSSHQNFQQQTGIYMHQQSHIILDCGHPCVIYMENTTPPALTNNNSYFKGLEPSKD